MPVQVHQHHNRFNWIQSSLHLRTVQVCLPAPPLCSLPLGSSPSHKVLLNSTSPSVTPQGYLQALSMGHAIGTRAGVLCLPPDNLASLPKVTFTHEWISLGSFRLVLVHELIFTSLLKFWAHLLHTGRTVPCPANSVMLVEQLPPWGKCVGRVGVTVTCGYGLHSDYFGRYQTTVSTSTTISISTNNCCAGRSEHCRLVAIVCCEFINLWSKSKFASNDIRESSNWSSTKPIQNSIWHPECYHSTGMKWNLMTAMRAVSNSAKKYVCLGITLLM